MIKSSINLLQPELMAKKPFFTLRNVVIIWGLVLAFMVAIAGYSQWHLQTLQTKVNRLEQQNQQLKAQSETLQQQLARHKPSSRLQAELDTLKALITNKKYLHRHLTNTDYSYIGGFASAMAELSALHHKDISLQHITIGESSMSFSGVARNANAVPSWLANFEQSQVLSGKTFQQFQMSEQQNSKLIAFSVSSTGSKLPEDK